MNGVCEVYYLTKDRYRILLLGEKHLRFEHPNAYDLLNYYIKASPVFLDLFFEAQHGKLSFPDEREAFNFDMNFTLNGNREVLPYRYHRFDLRNENHAKLADGLVNYDNAKILKTLQDLGPLPETEKEVSACLMKNFDSNHQIQKQVKKNDPAMSQKIRNYIIHQRVKNPPFLKTINDPDQTSESLRKNTINMIDLFGFLSDAYLLLRLFKKFDTKIHPKRAFNSIIHSGMAHTEIYADFLFDQGFEEGFYASSKNCLGLELPTIPCLFE